MSRYKYPLLFMSISFNEAYHQHLILKHEPHKQIYNGFKVMSLLYDNHMGKYVINSIHILVKKISKYYYQEQLIEDINNIDEQNIIRNIICKMNSMFIMIAISIHNLVKIYFHHTISLY